MGAWVCVAVSCGVLRCVAVWCSVLRCVAAVLSSPPHAHPRSAARGSVGVCCSELQCVAVSLRCSILQLSY